LQQLEAKQPEGGKKPLEFVSRLFRRKP